MFRILFVLFLIVPLFEIYLLLQVGGLIGIFNTIGLILLTAFLGTILLRQQGLSTLARFQNSLSQHQLPAIELLEGLMLLISGALLLTPGFFTDGVGFLVLVPSIRNTIAKNILSRIIIRRKEQGVHQETTIEAEYWEESDPNDRLP